MGIGDALSGFGGQVAPDSGGLGLGQILGMGLGGVGAGINALFGEDARAQQRRMQRAQQAQQYGGGVLQRLGLQDTMAGRDIQQSQEQAGARESLLARGMLPTAAGGGVQAPQTGPQPTATSGGPSNVGDQSGQVGPTGLMGAGKYSSGWSGESRTAPAVGTFAGLGGEGARSSVAEREAVRLQSQQQQVRNTLMRAFAGSEQGLATDTIMAQASQDLGSIMYHQNLFNGFMQGGLPGVMAALPTRPIQSFY